MLHYYAVPKIGDGLTIATAFAPKYFRSPQDPTAPIALSQMDYGLENIFLVAADTDATQHAAISANSDALSMPTPLTDTVSALALGVIQTKYEAGNLPAQWVTTSLTYQQVIALTLRLVQLMQRFHGMFGRLFIGGLTLDSRINQIPTGARTQLAAAAQSMGADTSSIVGTTLIREALVICAQQIFPQGLLFGGVTF
jgi:hypothetical protein